MLIQSKIIYPNHDVLFTVIETAGAFEAMRFFSSILWVKFLGSHARTRKSIQSPNWRYVGWILKAEHTLFGITHKIIHVGMHSYINLTNKYPIVFAITHRYSFPSERGQTVNAGAMWGCVPTPTCSCPPFSGPAYTLTRFSSHCCYYLGQFQV